MKRSSAIIISLGCACLLLLAVQPVKAEDAEATVTQLSTELQQKALVTDEEAKAIKAPLKEMIEKGASKEDLKEVVGKLTDKGVRGEELKQSVDSVRDMVKEGEGPKEAGNVVSQAAAQAQEQGLQGQDLAAKVHEAIKLRKAEKEEAKLKAEKAQKEADEKALKEAQEKSQKEAQEKAQKPSKKTKATQQKTKVKGK